MQTKFATLKDKHDIEAEIKFGLSRAGMYNMLNTKIAS